MKRWIGYALLALIVLFVVIQVVPYGRDHTNPPVVEEPVWDSPQTRELAKTACFDCHSNETVWPWYTNVAPVSWLIARDVAEGRQTLNFSEWQKEYDEADEAAQLAQEGEMPPVQFTLIHSNAKLSGAEKEALVQGLLATVGGELGGEGREDESDESGERDED